MESKELKSLNIEGLGTYSGGVYDRVSVAGKGTITGDLFCKTLDISGLSTLQARVEAEKVNVAGMGEVQGELVAEDMSVAGKLKCLQNVTSQKVDISGMVTIEQCCKTTKITSNGMLKVEGDLSSEEIQVEGILNCKGFLNCETLEIKSVGVSTLNEVGAATVVIYNYGSTPNAVFGFLLPKFLKENKVVANVIEGDQIILENCEVKVVRGKDIKIKSGCKIDTIEYSGELTVDERSEVGMINQL